MESRKSPNCLRSCINVILTLWLFMLLGPINMQATGSILRRMPIFYGKRDSAWSPDPSALLLERRLGSQSEHNFIPGFDDMSNRFGNRSPFNRAIRNNRKMKTLRGHANALGILNSDERQDLGPSLWVYRKMADDFRRRRINKNPYSQNLF